MSRRLLAALLCIAAFQVVVAPPAEANALRSQARPGNIKSSSRKTNNLGRGRSVKTMAQRLAIQGAGFGGLAPVFGGGGRNGLPRTTMDSFVMQAGGSANQIYGDEGANGKPPFDEFTPGHRIERGITSSGLTTGHASSLAPAWGGDEFVDSEGTTQSGGSSGGGSPANWRGSAGGSGANLRGDMAGSPAPIGGERSAERGQDQNKTPGQRRIEQGMPFDMGDDEGEEE